MKKGERMLKEKVFELDQLHRLMETDLVPYVQKVDQEAFYADQYLKKLGQAGYFSTTNKTKAEVILDRVLVIEETAKVCMTTAFCIWCHLAAITYLTNSNNQHLKQHILPKLITGEIIAGSGLSNPLKSFTHLEKIHLEANKVEKGFSVNGALPAISNIGENHAFAFIAKVSEEKSVMFFTSCDVDGLTMEKQISFVGLNGSATYGCTFDDVFIPEENIISYEAFDYVQQVRAEFVSYQIPLGLGVTAASIEAMEETLDISEGVNRSLRVQPQDLDTKYQVLYSEFTKLVEENDLSWEKIIRIRLEIAYLTLEAVQAGMIHRGGGGYIKTSDSARRLREAYFIVNLTPTIKHLEKILTEELSN